MASSFFQLEKEDLEKLQNAIIGFGDGAEQLINEYLVNEANQMFNVAIVNLIPVSNRDKKHAKFSSPIKGEQIANLELYIHTKTPYNYLYFPQNAEGTSRGKQPNDFMEKGINAEYDNVVNGMLDMLIADFDNII